MTRHMQLVCPPTAEELTRLLAEQSRPGGAFDPAELVDLDRREEFPTAACRALDAFGLPAHYVPAAYGGALASFTELVRVLRVVAGRDLTVAVAHGKTFLGTVCCWLAGRPEQAADLAERVLGGAAVAWGLTERDHGADLMAGELTATRTADGWRLSGEKWLINNATRGELVCVLARTGAPGAPGGPRDLSLFLVDKRHLPIDSYRCLPKIRTHGVRGADISGIELRDALVPSSAMVGDPGAGLEIVLKALQLTRIFSVGLSLGAADHALRLAVDLATERTMYARRMATLPAVRRTLGEVATTLLLAEAVAMMAAGSVTALPGELSVVSAIAKALVPTLVDSLLDQVAELLGVRGFLTSGYAEGAFQKLHRDHRVVSIFDGSTAVNRQALVNQFPALVRGYSRGGGDKAATPAVQAGQLDPTRLTVWSAAGCSLVQSLPDAVTRIRADVARGVLPPEAAELAQRLHAATGQVVAELTAHRPTARDVPAAAFDLAARYELCYAGAACLRIWLNRPAGQDTSAPLWRDGMWLSACLVRVLAGMAGNDCQDYPYAAHPYDGVAEIVVSSEDQCTLAGAW